MPCPFEYIRAIHSLLSIKKQGSTVDAAANLSEYQGLVEIILKEFPQSAGSGPGNGQVSWLHLLQEG